ncbi:hypothetical protein K461DRAFT_277603 [Myriangium duriaei CBS 260.36]|uniref:DUF7136 domain-containing protein n=1 Tax=Myriangium duriaei CBS 260.36 TaxID=1168546 RepID=A0A9P4MMK6_9PEZI|nr:hypothetical protein K461DRAFT_277603 [Myriangium duriaei CBS 260.36]
MDSWLGGVLICTLLLAAARAESHIPIQLDLIFPRNNTVYSSSIFPFPIVLKLHNATIQWNETDFQFVWSLNLFSSTGAYIGSDPIHSKSYLHDRKTAGDPQADDIYIDPLWRKQEFFVPNSGLSLGLRFDLYTRNACYSDGVESHSRFVNFTISPDGMIPDLTNSEPCALPLGALTSSNPANELSCSPQSNITRPLVQCAAHGSQTLADRVTMDLGRDLCPDTLSVYPYHGNVTWPDGQSRWVCNLTGWTMKNSCHVHRVSGIRTVGLVLFIGFLSYVI